MIVLLVVFVVSAGAQDHSQGPATPSYSPPMPFLDLFTGGANLYPDPIRKTYSEPSNYVSCPKSDSLSAFASILGSAAKIMFSAAIIAVLKMIIGKMLLLPVVFLLFAKVGFKAFLLWPMISKMMKYFKKKKKKGHKSRVITDCSQRIACVIQRSSTSSWASYIGATATFFFIDDLEEDSSFAKSMLSILSDDKIAECMSLDCSSGIDIS
ncbi:unnamed protein product [Chrysodeixis includens]|uniref:Uncharacterized protein n=1 Tax=Chrysodeixis includens TaxID=689277 RepID=A0A9N8L3G3_CHRIL|nr:unnamed protein product [Chrysodeixis includens]